MAQIYVAMHEQLITLTGEQDHWEVQQQDGPGDEIQCIAADPFNPGRLYCGTSESGLWRSNDSGTTWEAVGQGITHAMVTAVAVSTTERPGTYGVVWAGTEPSALYRSEDGGETWVERTGLQDIPSKPTWSFPPRPYTHHVRWLQPDPHDENRLFLCIELGGVMRSLDKGLTWEDYKPGSERDGHTLKMHPTATDRIYEAAGGHGARFAPRLRLRIPPFQPRLIIQEGGYAESRDGGQSWQTHVEGLEPNHYLWSVAVDPGDPDTVVASASVGPIQAHDPEFCSSFIVRRSGQGVWQRVQDGLPRADGMIISVLATHDLEPRVFYAANNQGVFRSGDGGQSWSLISPDWPAAFRKQHPQGILVV